MAPFSALVALCTLAPLLASIPLGELFFFHVLLIRKGITTYEYVIAMRARNDPRAFVEVGQQTIPSQQGGSNATSWRGLSSVLNLPHHGAWCTPRTVKQQKGEALSRLDEGKLPCSVDADSTIVVERKAHKSSKHVIKISALKLALLNPKEAAQAATKARESSSVLRPVGFHSFGTSETDCGSSCDVSTRSSMSLDNGPASSRKRTRKDSENSSLAASSPRQDMCKEERDRERLSDHSSSPGSAPLSPLPAERRFGNPNVLRNSVNNMQMKGLGDARHGLQVCNATILPRSSIEHPSWICTTPISDGGHDMSRSNQIAELGRSHIVSLNAHANGENHGNSRMAVYWDRAAGRFRSLPHTKKVSNLLSRAAAAETCAGPHSVWSPGRYPAVKANPAPTQGPWSISAPGNCGKENSLKWVGDGSRPVLIPNHIVLPSQSSKGPATFQCQSSTSTCRNMPRSLMLSRFTPS